MAVKRIFLSFSEEDRDRVREVRLLAAKPDSKFQFLCEPIRVPAESKAAEDAKYRIRDKIRRTCVTVCLIGEKSHNDPWVEWELEESDRRGNAVIVMALKGLKNAFVPKLIGVKEIPVYSWDLQHLQCLLMKHLGDSDEGLRTARLV